MFRQLWTLPSSCLRADGGGGKRITPNLHLNYKRHSRTAGYTPVPFTNDLRVCPPRFAEGRQRINTCISCTAS